MTSPAVARWLATGVGFLLVGTAGVLIPGEAAAVANCRSATSPEGVSGDVNGDGHAEVVAARNLDGFGNGAGEVHVFYGTARGLVADASGSARDDQRFSQSTPGIPGRREVADFFGGATAFGDFNGDGCSDLAIGASGDTGWRGTVTVLYGSKGGLTTRGVQRFTADEVFGGSEPDDRFGTELAVADFDDDGVGDLVASAPLRWSTDANLGRVAVLFGAPDGLGRGRPLEVLPPSIDPEGMATGDFDGDGVVELVAGNSDGLVSIERGPAGFRTSTTRVLTKASLNVPDVGENDGSGRSLAAGDVDADGRVDLAVGVANGACAGEDPDEDLACGPGSVVLVAGSGDGLTAADRQVWTQDSPGMGGTAEDGDGFGRSLVMGRFDEGPTADLAIGIPSDRVGSVRGAGSVSLLFGSASGLTTAGAGGSRFDQDSPGIPSVPKTEEGFGSDLAAARVQLSGQENLLIGVPGHRVAKVAYAGVFHQLAVSSAGPLGAGSVTLHLDRPGVKGTPARGDALTI